LSTDSVPRPTKAQLEAAKRARKLQKQFAYLLEPVKRLMAKSGFDFPPNLRPHLDRLERTSCRRPWESERWRTRNCALVANKSARACSLLRGVPRGGCPSRSNRRWQPMAAWAGRKYV